MIPKWLPNRLSIGLSNTIILMIFGWNDGCNYRLKISRRMAFKRSLISSQSPLKWPLMHGGIPIPRHATATGCLTPINGRISAHLAAPRPFYNSTEQRPLQATDALHADEHAIKKAALQARPHTIQFQSNLLSNNDSVKFEVVQPWLSR